MPKTAKTSSNKKKSTKKTSRKSKSTESKVDTKTQATPVVVEEKVARPATETKTRRKRRVVNKQSLLDACDTFLTTLTTDLQGVRETKKNIGIKSLRSYSKWVKTLRSDINRVVKERKKSNRSDSNKTSGFLKPVQISAEMSKFTGWDVNVPRSRVDVTKFLCAYIRDKNLQNPADRRQILPDKKLRRLLKVSSSELSQNPLFYYTMQKKIQHHFVSSSS